MVSRLSRSDLDSNGLALGKEVKDAAWYYPEPFEKAKGIKDHVAFYKNKVDVQSSA